MQRKADAVDVRRAIHGIPKSVQEPFQNLVPRHRAGHPENVHSRHDIPAKGTSCREDRVERGLIAFSLQEILTHPDFEPFKTRSIVEESMRLMEQPANENAGFACVH
jgi:hypothetical protein